MFGDKIDSEITMLQRVVALLRDLILGVVLLITCVIVYFGGDPSRLNVLDWTKLVGSAAFIIVGPVLVFATLKLLAQALRILTQAHFYFLYGSHLPKTFYAWVFLRLGRMSKRQYVAFWWERRAVAELIAVKKPRLFKYLLTVVELNNRIDYLTSKWYPYVLAALSLGASIAVFHRTVAYYIP